MVFVNLDRCFVEWTDKDDIDPEVWARFGASHGLLTWETLLARRRVVLLAEAGSGKSAELEECAEELKRRGHAAFFVTVHDVAKNGLTTALGVQGTAFTAWRQSDAPAWFFVDSVDEAKLDNLRLDTALQRLAAELGSDLARVHIILSGRHTDWEFRRDLGWFEKRLPVPVPPVLEEIDTEQELKGLIHNLRRREDPPKAERPLVVVMAGLDEPRIRQFATALGVQNPDGFVTALGRSHLWDFARRPLDLQWLARYWSANGRFGTFADMVEQSVAERSVESDPIRAGRAALSAARVREGLRRVGAAMVLARANTIAIPDGEISGQVEPSVLFAADVLPDWTAPEIPQFMRLPVFDPGTFGRTRLHNDNEGAVRGFLAADWLRELLAKGCPPREVNAILFAESYGHELTRPSMRETAAWLSLWDADTAHEVCRRDPFVLLNFGDPGSLPTATKKQVLTRFVEMLAADPDDSFSFDRDALQRFATPDIAGDIRTHWNAHFSNASVKAFLLRLIWLGELAACADLARQAAMGDDSDRYVRVFGGRALAAVGDEAAKTDFAAFLKTHCKELPNAMVWDGVDALFGDQMTVDDLLTILRQIDIKDADSVGGLEVRGEALTGRLAAPADLAVLISGLLNLARLPYGDQKGTSDGGDQVLPALVAAAIRLLSLTPDTSAPNEVLDVALLIGGDRHYRRRGDGGERAQLVSALHRTRERRRLAYWRASDRLQDAQYMPKPLDAYDKLEYAGWPPGLVAEDLDWLLQDAGGRPEPREKALAVDGALRVWHDAGRPAAMLTRINAAVSDDQALSAIVAGWVAPRQPSAESLRMQAEHEEHKRERAVDQSRVTASWKSLVDDLRGNPQQLRQLRPVADGKIDIRLWNVWQLLQSTDRGSSRYAIESAAGLRPLLGAEVLEEAEMAFAQFWRQWRPRLRSTRPPEEWNLSSSFDNLGIASVAMDARRTEGWATRLSAEEATLAAQYATLELNGFPPFLGLLAASQPDAVRDVLLGEIVNEFDSVGHERSPTLESVAYQGGAIARLLAPGIEAALRARPALRSHELQETLRALLAGYTDAQRPSLADLAIERAESIADSDTRVSYLGAALALAPIRATATLVAMANALPEEFQEDFLKSVIARFFSEWPRSEDERVSGLPFEVMETLTRAAYGAIKPQDDRVRRGSYTPDDRDAAESARGALLKVLAETPGRATFEVLLKLASEPVFELRRRRLGELALERAAQDSEHAPWKPAAVIRFERDFDDTPYTGADLQLLAQRRLERIQHDLTESDGAQAGTLRLLPYEAAVQGFFLDRMRAAQRDAYTAEREPHVVGEKAPDIRMRARTTDASVAIEIKNIEPDGWTIADLEIALKDQLCGKYLRHRDHRHGILLLVHRQRRPVGWRAPDGSGWWDFVQVVAHLRAMAVQLSAQGPEAPQPVVEVIDVAE